MSKLIIKVKPSATEQTVTVTIPDATYEVTGGTVVSPPIDLPPTTGPISLVIPAGETTTAPGTGMEQWHDNNSVSGVGSETGDIYIRSYLFPKDFYTGTTFKLHPSFIQYANEAKRRQSHLSFGVMTFYPGAGDIMPSHILNKIGYWTTPAGDRMPNYNHPDYAAWVFDFNTQFNAAIYANGFQDQIGNIDIRSYGSWGEWNLSQVGNYTDVPEAYRLTTKTGIAIVDAYLKGFPNFQLLAMVAAHDRRRLPNVWVDPAISDYILKASNNKGKIGIRWDSLGSQSDQYAKDWINTADPNRWKVAPITAEPIGNQDYAEELFNDVKNYHVNQLGNGNFNANPVKASVQALVRQADAIMGFHVKITGGTITGATDKLAVSLGIVSDGLVPAYGWKLVYSTDKGDVVSSFNIAGLIGPGTIAGTLTLPTGWSTLTLKLVNPGRPSLLNLKIK